jgi:hypothetical protein
MRSNHGNPGWRMAAVYLVAGAFGVGMSIIKGNGAGGLSAKSFWGP